MNKQLYEKRNNEYNPFFPIIKLEDIIDNISDKSIKWILNNYNHIYVEYNESPAITRNQVPAILRRNGLWISYNNGKDIVTEWYSGDNKDINVFDNWVSDSNWCKFEPLADGKVTYQHLSHALKQLLGKNNTITNFPDEEDLTTKDGVTLSFKDREYNEKNFSGMGRVILRKNIVVIDGVYKNLLIQDMINKHNTIYEIRYDFDLNGEEITIPEGCVLDFQGGSLSNGSIIGNLTSLFNKGKNIFADCTLKGTWNVDKSNSYWFKETNDDNLLLLNLSTLSKNIYLSNHREYRIKKSNTTIECNSLIGDGTVIKFLVDGDNSGLIINSKKLEIAGLKINENSDGTRHTIGNTLGCTTVDSIIYIHNCEFYGTPYSSFFASSTCSEIYVDKCYGHDINGGDHIIYASVHNKVMLITNTRIVNCTLGEGAFKFRSSIMQSFVFENNIIENLKGYICTTATADKEEADKELCLVFNNNRIWNEDSSYFCYLCLISGQNKYRYKICGNEIKANVNKSIIYKGSGTGKALSIVINNTSFYDTAAAFESSEYIIVENCTFNYDENVGSTFRNYISSPRLVCRNTLVQSKGNASVAACIELYQTASNIYIENFVNNMNVPICRVDNDETVTAELVLNNVIMNGNNYILTGKNTSKCIVTFHNIINNSKYSLSNNVIIDTPARNSGNSIDGDLMYNNDLKIPTFYNNGVFLDSEGKKPYLKVGNSESIPSNIDVGSDYFDVDKNVPMWYTGNDWFIPEKKNITFNTVMNPNKVLFLGTGTFKNGSTALYCFYITTNTTFIEMTLEVRGVGTDIEVNALAYMHSNDAQIIRYLNDYFKIRLCKNSGRVASIFIEYTKDGYPNLCGRYVGGANTEITDTIYTVENNDFEDIYFDIKPTIGYSVNRPDKVKIGFPYFDYDSKKPLWWSGLEWVDAKGYNTEIKTSGNFADKPISTEIGFSYFCTDRQTTEGATDGIMIYHKGENVWVDALGRVVE